MEYDLIKETEYLLYYQDKKGDVFCVPRNNPFGMLFMPKYQFVDHNDNHDDVQNDR